MTDEQRHVYSNALILVGEACKLMEQMQEFWRNGTPVCAGSELAEETSMYLKRVQEGPLPLAK